jgi:hypothetical protein
MGVKVELLFIFLQLAKQGINQQIQSTFVVTSSPKNMFAFNYANLLTGVKITSKMNGMKIEWTR